MNRNKLKNYAPQARRDFVQAVTDRAAFYGLKVNKMETVTAEQGDVAIIGGRAFPRSVIAKRNALLRRIEQQGFAQTMEAMAYTWFNRFVAIRYMELHGYLDHGYRVLSHPEDKQTPEIVEYAEHVELPGLDHDKVIELKLDGRKEQELYRMLLVAQCNALHAAMPFLFEKIDDETELLLPDNLLRSDSLIRKLVHEIDEEDWQQVEIIGWLYQFYISEKKDEVIGKVVKSEDIPAATQLFTPNWIVRYLVHNSIGRMWLQTYPDSRLRSKIEYYIEPAEQAKEIRVQLAEITPASIDPETITVLDPACGSGHILVEAYDLLKEIYLERGYRMRDIPRLILSKNLYGLDIDDRAAQLAAFALLMKGRADDRRIFDKATQEHGDVGDGMDTVITDPQSPIVNVLAIRESAHLDLEQLANDLLDAPAQPRPMIDDGRLFGDFSTQPMLVIENTKTTTTVNPGIRNLQSAIRNLLTLFRQAKTFGTLITIPNDVTRQLPAIEEVINKRLRNGNVWERPAADILIHFVRQATILAGKYDCVIANPPYMGGKGMNADLKIFAETNYPDCKSDLFAIFFQRIPQFVRPNGYVGLMTPFTWMSIKSYEGLRKWLLSEAQLLSLIQPEYHSFFDSAYVPICSFVFQCSQIQSKAVFIDLSAFYGEDLQPVKALEAISNPACGWRYSVASDDFKKIPGNPIAYQLSKALFQIFTVHPLLSKAAHIKEGLNTGDNDKFFRLWYEIDINSIKFDACSGVEAQQSGKRWFPCNKGGAFRKWSGNQEAVIDWKDNGLALRNFKNVDGKLLSAIRNTHFYFREGLTWSGVGSSGFSVRYFGKGFIFNSVGRSLFPFNNPYYVLGFLNSIVCSTLLKVLAPTLHFSVGDISNLPIALSPNISELLAVNERIQELIELAKRDWNSFEISCDFHTLPLLRPDLKAATVEQSFLNWQLQCQTNIRRLQELETENNSFFIRTYGLQGELSPDVPEEQITLARADREDDVRRLISYGVGCMMGRYSLDRNELVYAESGGGGFDSANYSTFPADLDGIVPVLESEWFADDATSRFIEFTGKAWPMERLEENLRYVAESLGSVRSESPIETIRRYFAQSFFKNHLKTYKKRPIYWLFSSGKQRAFQCLVYLHRYNEGTLARMRTEYVIPLQGKLAARIQQLEAEKGAASSTSHRKKIEKEQDTLKKQQTELVAFDEKLRHFADQRITLDLDDGVKVNYSKFGDLLAEVKTVTGGSED